MFIRINCYGSWQDSQLTSNVHISGRREVETCPPPRQYGPEKQAEIIKQIIKMLFDLDIIEILQVSGANYIWFLNLHLLVNGD